MSNGNPFYVKPATAMVDTAPLAQGLGAVAARAQQQKMQQARAAEMRDVISSGDPARVMDLMAKYPEISQDINAQIGFASDQTRNVMANAYVNSMLELEHGKTIDEEGTEEIDPAAAKSAEEILMTAAEEVRGFGGTPTNIMYDAERAETDPQGTLKRMQMGLLLSDPELYASLYGDPADPTKFQFGGQEMFKDDKGNIFFGTSARDPRTGDVEPRVTPLVQGTEPVGELIPAGGSYGETAQERTTRAAQENWNQLDTGQRMDRIEEYRAKIPAISTEIRELNNIIDAVDRGADTGVIANYFPNVTRATNELFQAARRLGLNIIQNTTFGALSEAEMNLAMETAVPTGMDEEELRGWAKDKIEVLYKLQTEVMNAVDHLAGGGTPESWERLRRQQMAEQREAGQAGAVEQRTGVTVDRQEQLRQKYGRTNTN